jgi:hypothetical protein
MLRLSDEPVVIGWYAAADGNVCFNATMFFVLRGKEKTPDRASRACRHQQRLHRDQRARSGEPSVLCRSVGGVDGVRRVIRVHRRAASWCATGVGLSGLSVLWERSVAGQGRLVLADLGLHSGLRGPGLMPVAACGLPLPPAAKRSAAVRRRVAPPSDR